MQRFILKSEPVWTASVELPTYRPLKHDIKADVCIVGAGIAGLSTAYLLAKAGQKVAVLDDGTIGSGQTAVTTAHLASEFDDRYFSMERLHGHDGARLIAESHSRAIDKIEQIARAEKIDCEFERLDGYLFAPPGDSTEDLDKEYEAARRTGVLSVDRLSRAPLDYFDTGPCLRFAQQGQFHPLKYLSGLAAAILKLGGAIYCDTHAKSIQGGEQARVETSAGPVVTADAVVVATNTPVNDMFAIHTKQAPYISYVVGLRVPVGVVTRALYWDTADPYHYMRLASDPESEGQTEIVVVGGEDHKSGQAHDGPERLERLEAWARERIPQAGDVAFRWAGQVMEPVDGVAFIGRNPMDKENVYIATGDSGQGMTHGTIAGMLLTDLILGKENPWASLYDPSRKTLGSIGEFTKENVNVAVQYASIVTPGEVEDASEIAPGEGAVMRRGMSKVAVYRSEEGKVCELSAICPHLKCVVSWNTVEKTWDCPCHGSRFTAEGKVVNGPANVDLEPIPAEE